MVLLTRPIGKLRQVVDPFVLPRNSIQESSVLKIRLVAIGLTPTNAEVEYWFYFSPTDPRVLEARAQEGHGRHVSLQRMFGGDLCECEIGRNHVVYVQPGYDRGCQRYPSVADFGTAGPGYVHIR